MLRFPNPSSKIRNFVRAYTVAHQELAGKIVQIDDIVRAVVGDNLATSSGHIGDEAIARSTKSDRSRDPLYNQVKMYAELFRVLGWIHSTETALRYTFTALGSQVAIAGQYYADIVAESALGITYPNPNIRSRTKVCNLRPFGLLLRMMAACEGELSRDEMIIGPLSAQSDQSQAAFNRTRARVLNTRLGKPHIKDQLQATSKELHVQINTLRNYTRWPIWAYARSRLDHETRDCICSHRVRQRDRRPCEAFCRSTGDTHLFTKQGRSADLIIVCPLQNVGAIRFRRIVCRISYG